MSEAVAPGVGAVAEWPYASGDIARRAGAFDWATTPLGARTGWSPRLASILERVFGDDMPMMALLWPGRVAVGNDALSALTGFSDIPLTESMVDALSVREADEAVREGGFVDVPFATIGMNGRTARVRVRHAPLHDDEGRVVGILSRFERLDGEPESALPLDDHRHRVRNMLALVRSVARRTAEEAASLDEYLLRFDGRLDALARVQAMLAAAPRGVSLAELAGEEALSQSLREGESVQLDGPDIDLRPRAAEVVGVVLHELMTDVTERSGDEGTAALRWSFTSNGDLALDWRASRAWPLPDDGMHDDAHHGVRERSEPLKRGFGRDVIEGMVRYELDASSELTVGTDAVHCHMELPGRHLGRHDRERYDPEPARDR